MLRPLAPALLLLAACGTTPHTHDTSTALPPIAPAPARGTEPMTNQSAVVVYSAGAEALFADPRDAGLRRAFSLLDDRLLDLADGESVAERVIRLVAAMGANPSSLRVDLTESGPIPLRAQLEIGGRTPAEAAALHRELMHLMADAGMDDGGMTPLGPLEHRVLGDGADARVAIALGGLDLGPLGLGSMDLPTGVAPTLAAKLDFASLMELLGQMMGNDADAAEFLAMMQAMGLVGDDGMAVHFAYGTDGGVGHVTTRTKNFVPAMVAANALETAGISADELGLIPTDAISASIAQSDPAGLLTYLEFLREPLGGDPLEIIQGLTGVHLDHDLIAHLGTTAGWYTSDSTGGGGMMSLVCFLEVENEQGLRETLDYGVQMLNDIAAMEADGHVEMRDWMHGDALCSSLTFPGLPIPIELSLAIHDGFLFFTLSPQALVAALDQRASGGPGLAANLRFRAAARGSLDDLTTLAFTDTARRAQDGYGLSTLVMAALANGVRTPEDFARDPGLVLPPYQELVGAGQASVLLGRIEGDDLVQTGTCDPSVAANVTAVLGSPIVVVLAMVGMAAIPMVAMTMPMMMMGAQADAWAYDEAIPVEWEIEDNAIGIPQEEAELIELLEGLGYVSDEEPMFESAEIGGDDEEPEEIIEEEPLLRDGR